MGWKLNLSVAIVFIIEIFISSAWGVIPFIAGGLFIVCIAYLFAVKNLSSYIEQGVLSDKQLREILDVVSSDPSNIMKFCMILSNIIMILLLLQYNYTGSALMYAGFSAIQAYSFDKHEKLRDEIKSIL